MINSLTISNFKSVQSLTLELGRVNVFIGENGAGKSNILEALVFADAAEAGKLDNEFLASRGLRVTSPELMRSGFEEESASAPIEISITSFEEKTATYSLINDNKPYSKWSCTQEGNTINADYFAKGLSEKERLTKRVKDLSSRFKNLAEERSNPQGTLEADQEDQEYQALLEEAEDIERIVSKLTSIDFLIYSPENTALRNFYKEGQIEPLGINGEGLLKLLNVIEKTDPEGLEVIDETLKLFGWYESMTLSGNTAEEKISIKDKYLEKTFDQRSANEGFLFVLFYTALIVSKDTPKIFAIDNIDTSLNPKLCAKLIQVIADLAKRFSKQVLLTSHNPAVLDGLDLNDEKQKLFVVSRNKQGYTRCKNIDAESKPKSATGEALKLSEALLRGYLGGLPKGF